MTDNEKERKPSEAAKERVLDMFDNLSKEEQEELIGKLREIEQRR